MILSSQLLNEISKWSIVEVPSRFFHGCCDGDIGLDLHNSLISGNKWFSTDPYYAGEYAWHYSRPVRATRARVELKLIHSHLAIEQPKYLEGEPWAPFLSECFPDTWGYDLSRIFQDTLAAHIEALNVPNLHSFVSNAGREICIPNVERFVEIVRVIKLPTIKACYRQLNGLI